MEYLTNQVFWVNEVLVLRHLFFFSFLFLKKYSVFGGSKEGIVLDGFYLSYLGGGDLENPGSRPAQAEVWPHLNQKVHIYNHSHTICYG